MVFIRSIKSILKKISFPRLVGTKGEKAAAQIITNFLKSNKYDVSIEKFTIPNPKLETIFSAYYLALFVMISFSLFFSKIFISVIVAIIFLIFRLNEYKIKLHISKIESQNIFACKKRNNKPILLITSHYDSSEIWNPFTRKHSFELDLFSSCLNIFRFFVVFLIGILMLASILHFSFLLDIFNQTIILWLFVGCILSILFITRFVFIFSSKNSLSSGADDNGSGVSISLYLAQLLKNKKFNFNINYLFLDAEEAGFLGAKNWIKMHKNKNGLVINLDILGRGNYFVLNKGWGYFLKTYADIEITKKIKSILKNKYFETWDLLTDAFIFSKNKFRVFSISRANKRSVILIEKLLHKIFQIHNVDYKPSTKWNHTEDDIYEKIDIKKLNESKNIILKLIKNIDKTVANTRSF